MHWERDGYVLRPAVKEDVEEYYEYNFNPLDGETARLTGSKPDFTSVLTHSYLN